MRQDLRDAVRALRKRPGFAAVIVLTLALGISLSTAVVSVFNAVVLRPVAYPHPDRLLWMSTFHDEEEPGVVLGPDFVDWRARATSFERMAAYGTWDANALTAAGPVRARLVNVTEDFWDLTGATARIGRLPHSQERDAVVLSHAFAQRWFGDERTAVGRAVVIEGDQVTIVGVFADDFRFHLPGSPWPGFQPKAIDIYQPTFISPAREGMIGFFNVFGRLAPGVTIEQARAELEAIRTRLAQEHPSPYPAEDRRRLRVVPLQEQLVGNAQLALVVLLAAVMLVLLVACANTANLLLARASTRHNEIAIRVSLGAGRVRVLQQCLVESLFLAALGCAAGLIIAQLAVAAILRFGPATVPRLGESTIDGTVVAIACGLSVASAFLFGLVPAFALWRVAPHDALRDQRRVASAHVGRVRSRGVILATQIALALVLLIGAGLLVKSAWRLTTHPAGFEPARILTLKIEFDGEQFRDSPARQFSFVERLLEGLTSQPRVEAASISTHGYMLTQGLIVEGDSAVTAAARRGAEPLMINATTGALARVMGLHMISGRWFSDHEASAVINEQLARREFPGENPIGRRIRMSDNEAPLTIVGIVAGLRYSKLDATPPPELFVPYSRTDGIFGFTVLVRTAGDPAALAADIRPLVTRIDPTQVPDEVMTLERALAQTIVTRRWNLLLLATFALSALMLALIGMYGVVSYWVAERRHEIGVRMALGAMRMEVVRMVVRQAMGIALAGIAVGIAASLALTGVMASLLYDVRPTDAPTFLAVTASLAAVTLAACYVPASRASRVDPATALRHE